MNDASLSRRKFLTATGFAGGGLVPRRGPRRLRCKPAADHARGRSVRPQRLPANHPDNVVRFFCPRDEMGQGITTGLATIIGEELDVAPWNMEVVFAGPHEEYANPIFGVQITGGSTSVRGHYQHCAKWAHSAGTCCWRRRLPSSAYRQAHSAPRMAMSWPTASAVATATSPPSPRRWISRSCRRR